LLLRDPATRIMISCHSTDTPLPQKEENDSFFIWERGSLIKEENNSSCTERRLSKHRKRRKTPLV
jgi:hypothetical protein